MSATPAHLAAPIRLQLPFDLMPTMAMAVPVECLRPPLVMRPTPVLLVTATVGALASGCNTVCYSFMEVFW